MKISLRQIGNNGLEFCETVNAAHLDLPPEIVDCVGPLTVSAFFQRAGAELLAECEVTGRYRVLCSRCLKEFEIEKTDRFDLAFDITPATEFIEFSDDIRQELMLAANVKSLCKEDCKGICAHCGADLNNETCTCKKDT